MLESTGNMQYTKNIRLNLSNSMRNLWVQHVMWTRSFIISTAASLEDLQAVTKRLLRNPTDFAIALSLFYPEEIAKKFEALLREHLLIGAKLVNHAKEGNTEEVRKDEIEWYRNADEIAFFLASINPYWNAFEWRTMLYKHLRMTEREAVERLNKRFENDIAEYDLIEQEALLMADMMTYGLINQFKL